MFDKKFLFEFARHIHHFVRPLLKGFSSEPEMVQFFQSYGWNFDASALDPSVLKSAVGISDGLEDAFKLITQAALDSGETDFATIYDSVSATVQIITSIKDLSQQSTPPAGLTQQVWDSIKDELFDNLLVTYLKTYHTNISSLLVLFGVIQAIMVEADPAIGRDAHIKYQINWQQIGESFSNPTSIISQYIITNNPLSNFNFTLFFGQLFFFAQLINLEAEVHIPLSTTLDQFYQPNNPARSDVKELCLTLMKGDDEEGNAFNASLSLLPIPDEGNTSGCPSGIAATIKMDVTGTPPPLYWPYSLEFSGDLTNQEISFLFWPAGQKIKLGGNAPDIDFTLAIMDESPFQQVILGSRLSSHLYITRWKAGIHLFGKADHPDLEFYTNFAECRLIVDMSGVDGFLKEILPAENLEISFSDLTIGYSTQKGFYLQGNVGLEIVIALDLNFADVFTIDSLFLGIKFDGSALRNVIAINAGVELGPVAATVEKIGMRLDLSVADNNDGNLGPLNLNLGFKPPNGAGLVIDCSAVTGGGYLSFDDDAKSYDGILQLRIGDFSITAIGLITTKMPDGSNGFSMLLIICVEFSPPIQLSFGFTLSGIGGMAGYNRTMVIDVLQTGLRNRTLDSILFPKDPVKNATKIISDLKAVLPPAEGRFVLGPMIKLGWGSPNIITANIGVFIELPEPIRIVLLGQIAAILPCKDNAIIELHIDILGVLDFGQKLVAIDASIYDSRILTFTLTGDAALRFCWGDNPCFAMSLGGFHPQFSPPPSFPALRRLTLSIGYGETFQIYCRCYQALTSNSLQFGSSVELFFQEGGVCIQGGLTFDTLIYFSPFSFMVDLNGNVSIKYKGRKLAGIYIAMSLSGPKPWNAMGSARIEILFWDLSVDFQVTWGDAQQEVLPSVDPWEPLREALERNESWGSTLPQTISMVEIIKPAENSEPAVILIHPAGRVEVRQNILPFGVQLQKLGNSPVKDHYRFEIGALTAGQGNTQVEMVSSTLDEFFARGQYQNLSETQRVSLPAFEEMPGGTCAGTDVIQFADQIKTMELTYESILIQDNDVSTPRKVGKTDWQQAKYQTRGNASGRKNQSTPGIERYETKGNTPKVAIHHNEGYVIVKQCDLTLVDLGPENPPNDGTMNRMQADQTMLQYLQDHPEQIDEVKVIAEYEVVQ